MGRNGWILIYVIQAGLCYNTNQCSIYVHLCLEDLCLLSCSNELRNLSLCLTCVCFETVQNTREIKRTLFSDKTGQNLPIFEESLFFKLFTTLSIWCQEAVCFGLFQSINRSNTMTRYAMHCCMCFIVLILLGFVFWVCLQCVLRQCLIVCILFVFLLTVRFAWTQGSVCYCKVSQREREYVCSCDLMFNVQSTVKVILGWNTIYQITCRNLILLFVTHNTFCCCCCF